MTRPAPDQIRQMFDQIVPRYDLLNHLLSSGLDILWRRRTARLVARCRPRTVVDLCCGTGDLAAGIARRLAPAPQVIGLDFSPAMIERARRKYAARAPHLQFNVADALATGLPDSSADAVTCAFGLRNVADLHAFLRETRRILRPGGTLFVVEFFKPPPGLRQKLFRFYFRRLLPIVGRWISGHHSAYTYLPDSVEQFIASDQLAREMSAAGFDQLQILPLVGGAATLVRGRLDPTTPGGAS